jgi:transposase
MAAEAYHADQSDSYTLVDSVMEAQGHLRAATGESPIAEVAADKAYHAAEPLELAGTLGLRTYIPEPERKHPRRWTDKPPELQAAVYANRRRTKTDKGRRLQRLRSERVERTFAHVCETGGARRTWLRGIEKVRKRLLMSAVAHNLGVLMRALFGMGTPRGLQKAGRDSDGLAALLRLARLVITSLRTALATFGNLTFNLRRAETHQADQTLAA